MAGHLTLQVLDGQLQSTRIPLQQNYIFDGAFFQDKEMNKRHAKIIIDSNFNWKISSLEGNKLRIGHEEIESISLIPGLIFHMGETGFKVIEKPKNPSPEWEKISAEFIDNINFRVPSSTDLFFFLFPVQIRFIQGAQSGSIYTLSYGPRIMGSNHLDLNIKDLTQPHQLLRFSQVGDKVMIENLSHEAAVTVNKNTFSHHVLSSGDRFAFGSNIVEISILK